MNRYTMTAAVLAALFLMAPTAHAVAVNWTGGVGNWEGANWDGGSTAAVALGRSNGWQESDGVVLDPDITISGAGVCVFYDSEFLGDFHLRSDLGGTGELIISAGAKLVIESSTTTDGVWTEIDARGITVTGAGSELRRTHTNATLNGGAFVWGSWQNDPGEVIEIKVLDNGSIDNEGQTWFGAYGDSEIDLDVSLQIGKGASYSNHGALRGGISLDDSAGAGNEGEINFIWNYYETAGATDDSVYNINFDGQGGKLTVGPEGIRYQEGTSSGNATWNSQLKTYQDLWNDGILTHNSPSGPLFGDSFTVTTSLVAPIVSGGVEPPMNTILTSIAEAAAGGANPGDINGDFAVDAADIGVMFANWGTGTTVAEGDINAAAPADDLIDAADFGVLAANFTGDPGPAGPGEARAEYDPATG